MQTNLELELNEHIHIYNKQIRTKNDKQVLNNFIEFKIYIQYNNILNNIK